MDVIKEKENVVLLLFSPFALCFVLFSFIIRVLFCYGFFLFLMY